LLLPELWIPWSEGPESSLRPRGFPVQELPSVKASVRCSCVSIAVPVSSSPLSPHVEIMGHAASGTRTPTPVLVTHEAQPMSREGQRMPCCRVMTRLCRRVPGRSLVVAIAGLQHQCPTWCLEVGLHVC
jgi:hypothetical protein